VDWLACKSKQVAQLYETTVGREYRREREKFDLSNSKRILHIGGGPYPITAMVLAENDGAEIVTIDNNHGTLKLANKIIDKNDLSSQVSAKYGCGTKYPLKEFDAVIISGCSTPKRKVLEHVLENSNPQSRIIIRSSALDVETIVKSMNPDHDISIIGKMENYAFPTAKWDSYFLIKNY